MENCVICKVVHRELPGFILSDSGDVAVLVSLENHVLVVPKKHIQDIYALDAVTGAKLMEELVRTSIAVNKGLGCEGVYITQANEPAAGQDVFHLHFHVYPRWHDQLMNQVRRVGDQERAETFVKLKGSYS